MKNCLLIAALLLVNLPAGSATADGQQLYFACATCHGYDGGGSLPLDAPRIAGLEPWYVADQLRKFANGQRGAHPEDIPGQQMALFARALPDDVAIEAVAGFVSELDAPTPGAGVTGDAERGRRLYQSCRACHGSRAAGNPALRAPGLTQLDDWYLVAQLEAYRAGLRGYAATDVFGQQMRNAAAALTSAQDIRDVVTYIRGIQVHAAEPKLEPARDLNP